MSYLLLLTFIILNPLKDFNTTLRVGFLDWYNFIYLFIVAAWIVRSDVGWLKIPINRNFLLFIGFFIFSYIRGFAGPFPTDPMDSLMYLKTIVTEVFLFFIFLNFIITRKQIRFLVYGLAAVMAYEAFIVFNQYIAALLELGSDFSWEFKSRITGTFLVGGGGWGTASANEVGSFFSLYILFIIGFAVYCENKFLQKILYMLGFVCFFPMLFSMSRGAWLGFFLSIVLFLLRKNRKLLIVFIMLIVLAMPFLPSSVTERGGSVRDRSAQGRIEIWLEGLSAMTHPPYFIAGTGFRQAEHYFGRDAHNSYIRVMLESGIPGLICMIILFFNIAKALSTILVNTHDPTLKGVVLGTLLAFYCFVILNMVGTRLYNGSVSASLWAWLGVAMKADILQKELNEYSKFES